MRWQTGLVAAGSIASLLCLAGCGGDAPAAVFKAPSYSYLTKLRLNVAAIRIKDQVPPPGPSDLANQAPTPPEQAMTRMAQDRLVAGGTSGMAVFTIDQAAITGQPGSTLDGTLAAHLDIIDAKGGHEGYAEAHVSREFVPGSPNGPANGDDGLKAQLYDLTNQMMSDMNVEFEFQLRRTMGDWMLDASGAPVAAAVQEQPLSPPGSALPSAAGSSLPNSVGAPVQLAPPPGAVPQIAVPMTMPVQAPTPDQTSGPVSLAPPPMSPPPMSPPPMSPQPGFLTPPPGTVSVPAGPAAMGGPA